MENGKARNQKSSAASQKHHAPRARQPKHQSGQRNHRAIGTTMLAAPLFQVLLNPSALIQI
jgi:hypothetical protein